MVDEPPNCPPFFEPCTKCSLHGRGDDPNPATEDHTCPFQVEVHDNTESKCDCCDDCSQECSDDV